jgi:pimeloyl-ACP methyl ester carboxylesterase
MLARIQQLTTTAIVSVALVWAAVALWSGRPAWALGGFLLISFAYSAALAIEFALARAVHGNDPAPEPSIGQLIGAWAAEALAALRIFCWAQPFRSWRWPDRLPEKALGKRGVVLVHGFVCNRGIWNHWLHDLTARATPFVAVNLEPVFGSIDQYKPLIEEAVARVERCTGRPPIIVAHSMGGLAARHWYADQSDVGRIHHVITIGTPHRGTWLARFAFSSNGRQMRCESPWLAELAQREGSTRAARFTCFYSSCDNIVFPPSSATLPSARNIHLPGTAHVDMALHRAPRLALDQMLGVQSPAPGRHAPA